MSENQYKVLISKVKGLRTLVPYNNEFYTSTFDKLIAKPSEQYESIYIYNQEHFDQFKKTKSLAGISGVKTDKIVFDFDSKEDVEKALQDTRTVVSRLKADGFADNEIGVAFSSNKGFHVVVGTDELFSRDQFEAITGSYAGDLETFDTTVSDEQRVFRLPLSFNPVSNKYKIPVGVQDILNPNTTAEEISLYAAAPNFQEDKDTFLSQGKAANKFKVKVQEKKSKISERDNRDPELVAHEGEADHGYGFQIDFKNRPQHLTPTKYALQEGYFEEGERNEACLILASTYKFLGYDETHTYYVLKATLEKRSKRLGIPKADKNELWETIIEPVFGPHWKGGTFSDKEGLLKKIRDRFSLAEQFGGNTVIEIGALLDVTENFLKNLDKNRIYTGLEELDKELILTRGMLFGVLGCPGSGKTSFLNVFCETTSKKFGPVLYNSFDMSKDLLGTKVLQRYTGYELNKLQDIIKHGVKDKLYMEARERLAEDYKNVHFCFENGYDIGMISDEIKRVEDKVGSRLAMVAVDYLEKVQGPYSDATANSGFIASNLANLAKKHDTCMGLLLQPSKMTGSPSDAIKSYRAIKGASVIEQDCRAVIGIWRPGYSPDTFDQDRYMSISILKQNMGKLGKYDFNWDGARGHVSEMTKEERTRFNNFLGELEAQKAEAESQGGHTFKRFGQGNGDAY